MPQGLNPVSNASSVPTSCVDPNQGEYTGSDPGSGIPTPMPCVSKCGCSCIAVGGPAPSAGSGGGCGCGGGGSGGGGSSGGGGCSGGSCSGGGTGGGIQILAGVAPHTAQLQAVRQQVAPFTPAVGGSSTPGSAEIWDSSSGNLLRQWSPPMVDLLAPVPALTYNSLDNPGAAGMPANWIMLYNRKITNVNSTTAALRTGTGGSFTYSSKNATTGVYSPPDNAPTKLVQNANGTWTETQNDGTVYSYLTSGALSTISNGGGVWTVSYDTSNRPKRVTDPVGRATTFAYKNIGYVGTRLSTITDAVGRVSTFGYDSQGLLTKLVSPAAEVTTLVNYSPTPQLLAWVNPKGERTT